MREFPVVSQSFVLDHVHGLLAKGHDVRVLRRKAGMQDPQASPSPVEAATWLPSGGRSRRALNKLRLLTRVPPATLPRLLRGAQSADLLPLAALLRGLDPQPELLHAHFGQSGELLAQLRRLGLIRQPLLVSVHGFDINRPLAGHAPGYEALFDQADRIIVASEFMRRQTERLGCPPDRIRCIPFGLDADRFAFAPRSWRPGQTLRVLSVARLVEQKGLARGILAVAALRQSGIDVQYSIVGDGPLRAELERTAATCGVADVVQFAGAQTRDQVIEHFARHHLFLFPCTRVAAGDEEGQGIVLLEAQACGLPILATRHGGIPENVDEGRSALIVDDDDEAFRAGLQHLVGDAGRWPEMGQAGRLHVQQHFRYDTFLAKIEAEYREVLSRCRSKPVPAE